MRLIDADALIDVLTQRCCKNCVERMGTKNGKRQMVYEIGDAPCLACEVDDIKVELDEAPTIEAVPVKNGKWVGVMTEEWCTFDECKCSVCGVVEYFNKGWKKFSYCPNCGAKMDEVGE